MSATAAITLAWGDGEHTFRLAIGQLRELQEKCNAGPFEIADRLETKRWRIDDLREVLRLGLIGGGKAPAEALTLVRRYVDERPFAENVYPAYSVLLAALVGAPDDPVGKAPAEEAKTEAMAASSSPPSTATEPS